MLLRNDSKVRLTVDVNLYFDDESERHTSISEKDIIRLVYNKNGVRDVIEGKVKRIEIINKRPPAHDSGVLYRERTPFAVNAGYHPIQPPKEDVVRITIDGSDMYQGKVSRVYIKDIIDIEMIEKYDESLLVKTVSTGNGQINRIKIFDEKIFFSSDNGETYDYYLPLQKTSEIGKDDDNSNSGNSNNDNTSSNDDSNTNDDTVEDNND